MPQPVFLMQTYLKHTINCAIFTITSYKVIIYLLPIESHSHEDIFAQSSNSFNLCVVSLLSIKWMVLHKNEVDV